MLVEVPKQIESPKLKERPKGDAATLVGAVFLGLLLLGVVFRDQLAKIDTFFYGNLSSFVLLGAGGIFLTSLLATYLFCKWTEPFKKRARTLLPLTKADNAVYIGRTKDGLRLNLPHIFRRQHTQAIAATGHGKTTSVIVPWACRDLMCGNSVILIDGKGDPDLITELSAVTEKLSIEPELFDLADPTCSLKTNPLAHGSAQQITDRIFSSFSFDNSYYKAIQYELAGSVIELAQANNLKFNFSSFHQLLTSDESLKMQVDCTSNSKLRAKLTEYLQMSEKKERVANIAGLTSQIGPFAEGEVARLVNSSSSVGGRSFEISDLLLQQFPTKPRLMVFLLPTLKYQEIAKQLGKLLLQELAWATGERSTREGKRWPFASIYLDEFSAFVYDGFHQILNKARSSQIALHLSHQSMGDLEAVSKEFAKSVMTNTNVKCVLGLNDAEDAEMFARLFGTESQDKLTEKATNEGFFGGQKKTGEVSIREVEAFKYHPNLLKSLPIGQGIIHFPTHNGNVTELVHFEPVTASEINREKDHG